MGGKNWVPTICLAFLNSKGKTSGQKGLRVNHTGIWNSPVNHPGRKLTPQKSLMFEKYSLASNPDTSGQAEAAAAFQFQGRSSSRRAMGWPPAMRSRMSVR